MLLIWLICGYNQPIDLKSCQEVLKVFTASGSTINGGSYSNGALVMLTKWKLLIIIKAKRDDKTEKHTSRRSLIRGISPSLYYSAYKLAKDIGIPQTRVAAILKGRRRVTADTALRLGKYFGNSPKFWLGLQDDFDLEEEGNAKSSLIDNITTLRHNAA